VDYSAYRHHRRFQSLIQILIVVILLALIYWAASVCRISPEEFITGISSGLGFLRFMFPPDWSAFRDMLTPAVETIMLGFLATVFGSALSLLVALAAAGNLAPPWLRNTSRFLITIERALPEIIILLLLVAALGLGPFAGVIALSLGCVGMLGRLFADAIEEVDPRVLESIESLGANKLQLIAFGVLPQVLPSIIANTIFRFEVNIRLSVLLGAVGAGGIGFELSKAFSLTQYEKATTALLVTLALVFLSERVSDFLRKKITPDVKLR
jgi:phosphonate transport system permease protein